MGPWPSRSATGSRGQVVWTRFWRRMPGSFSWGTWVWRAATAIRSAIFGSRCAIGAWPVAGVVRLLRRPPIMTEEPAKAAGRARVADLIRNFQRHETEHLKPAYNETQARTDFITPLLQAFGWAVHNKAGQPLGLREVIEEATVEVGEERLSKKPDYELRLARQRKLFVEAKKPVVRV